MENKTTQRLIDSAINEAVKGNWEQAITLNEDILKLDKEFIDPYLRIGYAYMQLGKYDLAK